MSLHNNSTMSLLTAVEEAIKLTKKEQGKLNDDIQLYREILQSLKPQTNIVSKDLELADNSNEDSELLPEEKEEIELLEQALQKAMRIRSGIGPFKEPQSRDGQDRTNKPAGCTVAKNKGGAKPPGNSKSTSSASKSTSHVRKDPTKSRASSSSLAGGRGTTDRYPGQCRSRVNDDSKSSIQKCPVSDLPRRSTGKEKQRSPYSGSVPGHLLSDVGLDKAASGSVPSHTQKTPASSSGSRGTPQNEICSKEIRTWKSLRSRKDRLWDKVMAVQSNPVPERSHFMERMRATFPKDCCAHSSPDQTRALVAKLTQQAEALLHSYQSQQVLAKQTSAAETVPGSGENNYKETNVTLESLDLMAAELRTSASQVKREWESWDRWRPEGGCLCMIGVKGEWGERLDAPLPPTVTYSTEAELRELERLRMRVTLLQRDLYLQQALSRSLLPQLSSILSGPGCPQPSVIRDIYSILADNGEKFPALVLDSDQD